MRGGCDFETLERIARMLSDDRYGEGHFDRKGTKRNHWRRQAQSLAALSADPLGRELMRACGWPV